MLPRIVLASIGTLALFSTTQASPLKRSVSGPVISSDFPDPALIQVGSTWYAFASQSVYQNTNIHIQVGTSNDFSTWSLSTGTDALPNLPSWAVNDGQVWAPDVKQIGNQFVMYFSATAASDPGHHCIGVATSSSVTGPYTPTSDSSPWVCPTTQGGAIDPSQFLDDDGSRYVVYKIDGNSLGNGGSCDNSVAPIASTPIMIQQVESDGITPTGAASELFANDAADGPDVEAPMMIKSGGVYFVFFSSNCYSTTLYDVSYATSSSPTSGFTKSSAPLFLTGTDELTGPGGASVWTDNEHMVLHGQTGGGIRALYTATVSESGTSVSA